MKCVIPGANVKILARAIHALAKIGEEIYVQPQERALSFRSVGGSNSAFCDFTFRDNFFSYYNYGDLEEDDALKCKVSMRGAIAVFKTPGTIDKLVETCHIRLQPNGSDLIFILKYKNSVIKTFLLPILNCETLQASYNKDGLPNQLTIQPKVLNDVVQNFQQNLIEITMDVTEEKILMRNYVNDSSSAEKNAPRTQLALAIGEFDKYIIGQNACVTFCMKEVRAILAFADIVSLPIHIQFEIAGRPIVFVLRNQSFEVNLVLATMNPDIPETSHTSVQERRAALKKRAGLKRTPKTAAKPRKKAAAKLTTSTKKQTTNSSTSIQSTVTNVKAPTTRGSKRPIEHNDESLIELVRSTSITNRVTTNHKEPSQDPTRDTFNTRDTQRHLISETPSSVMTPSHARISSAASSPSMFSASLSVQPISERTNTNDNNIPDDDFVPNSPPRQTSSKKARLVFKKCFQNTFDPRMLPGHDRVLAKDSDESD